MSYISYRLHIFKIAASSEGVFQQTTALNNVLALWVRACWHIPCKCCKNMLSNSSCNIPDSTLWVQYFIYKTNNHHATEVVTESISKGRHCYRNVIFLLHLIHILYETELRFWKLRGFLNTCYIVELHPWGICHCVLRQGKGKTLA